MPPPKTRLHNKTGKLKNLNKPSTSLPSPPQISQTLSQPQPQEHGGPSASTSSSAIINGSTNDDADRQFELELCWCIQTLETSLATGKLNAKQGNSFKYCYPFVITVKCYSTRHRKNYKIVKKFQTTDN